MKNFLLIFVLLFALNYKVVKETYQGNKVVVIIQVDNNGNIRYYKGNGFGSYNYAKSLAIEDALRKLKFNQSDSISYRRN